MASPRAETRPIPHTKTTPNPQSAAKRAYLTLYNGISCALWGVILFRVVSVLVGNYNYNHSKQPFWAILKGRSEGNVWDETGEFVKWVQTGALLEVVHSLVGKSHSSR